MTESTIELTMTVAPTSGDALPDSPRAEDGAAGPPGARHEFSLPPVDGGKDAWLFLAASFFVEALVWGFPFAFGVFQKYYTTHEPFAGSSNIAVIGTCAMGLMYLAGPLPVFLFRSFPRFGRWASISGLLVMCGALAASSFSTSVTQLIATQGVLYALGGCLAYWPCILYMDEWFARRKGLAYGIMWSGTGLAGVILPLFLEYLLDAHGFRTALRLWAGILFAATAPLSYFVKPRLPLTTGDGGAAHVHARPMTLRFVLSPLFLAHQAANIIEATGFFLPGIYLPLYAQAALGAGAVPSALTILLLNVASVFGCVAMGHLVDRLPVTTCLLASTLGAAASVWLLWGFATSLPVLYAFCVLYGLFAGSYTSAWPGIMKQVTRSEAEGGHGRGADPSMVFGCLAAGRGVGNVVSGPLSEVLVRGLPFRGRAAGGYGTGYGALIVFTGITALVGGASFCWKRIRQA